MSFDLADAQAERLGAGVFDAEDMALLRRLGHGECADGMGVG